MGLVLQLIGLVALCGLAVYLTVGACSLWLAAAMFPGSGVAIAAGAVTVVATALWALVYYLAPFRVVVTGGA